MFYIGMSENLLNRWGSHHRYRQAVREAARKKGLVLRYQILRRNKKNLLIEERKLIDEYKPLWNDTPVPSMRKKKVNRSKKPQPSFFSSINSFHIAASVVLGILLLSYLVTPKVNVSPIVHSTEAIVLPSDSNYINLRSSPVIEEGNIIGQLPRNTIVTLINDVSPTGWILIRTETNEEGWVYADNIETVE